MGWFDKLFKKEFSQPMKPAAEDKTTDGQLAQRIFERLRKHTAQPVLKLSLRRECPGILQSKIGGAYYVPSGEEPPKDKHTGRLLFLLAQLNFAELPRLADFPEHGLLQFFIAGDDLYGCDFDHATEQVSWAVRYVEDLPEPEEISPKRMFEPDRERDDLLPLESESLYKLTGEPGVQAVTSCDYRIDACLREYCADLLPAGVQSFYDLGDETCETLQDLLETYACQVGGYPCFTQWDPREREKDTRQPDVLLFQLDTVEDIMWGDSGVGNFFITREDLKNRDFSRVLYNWDCC